jgi:hypothetical protein
MSSTLLVRRPVLTAPVYSHLLSLSTSIGVFEHAEGDMPRREHGYCVDDVARALIVAVRDPGTELSTLADTSLGFLAAAIGTDGRVRNRMSDSGEWTDEPDVGDWWGRAAWALGSAAARHPELRAPARAHFMRLCGARSPHIRATAYACLGAAELMRAGDRDRRLEYLMLDAIDAIPMAATSSWDWPESTLRYGNGSIVEALIAAGSALGNPAILDRGLELLGTLLELETRDGHLSVAGTGGRGPLDVEAQYDQQPIEVAAIADAAALAYELTGDEHWVSAVQLCWDWFLGVNDVGIPMVDLTTGAGFDGLEPGGRNDNRGAESTLAALTTWQQVRRLTGATL